MVLNVDSFITIFCCFLSVSRLTTSWNNEREGEKRHTHTAHMSNETWGNMNSIFFKFVLIEFNEIKCTQITNIRLIAMMMMMMFKLHTCLIIGRRSANPRNSNRLWFEHLVEFNGARLWYKLMIQLLKFYFTHLILSIQIRFN